MMKKFLYSLLIFFLPIVLLVVALEAYVVFYPSTFNLKAKDINTHTAEVKTIILGSSHNQNALNPEYFTDETVNLANAGQDAQLDSALFFTYAPKLSSLKLVILEIDYLTMEEKNPDDYFRLSWYKRFYGFELGHIPLLNKISLYASSPSFFNKLLTDAANPKKIRYQLNDHGFIMNDFPGVMEDLHYDTLALATTAAERLKDKHKGRSVENFNFNRAKLNAIIGYCSAHRLKVLIISNPMYSTYIREEIPEKNERRFRFTDSLASLPGVTYFNFERSPLFNVHDFKNDDHLNSNGAKKYTHIVDSIATSILKK